MVLEAKIDKSQIENLQRFFNATTKELNDASNRTIRKTITWIKGKIVKDVSSQTGVQQKSLKKRTRTSINTIRKEGRVWFGTYRISLIRLSPKQNKRGVKAGSRGSIFRQSAFIAPIKNSVMFSHQVFKRTTKKRLPIEKQVFDYSISTQGIENDILPRIPTEVEKKLRQELNWETIKR